MKMMFPGDHPEIVYPMFEKDYGGAAAIHPLQLHTGRVSLDRAGALVKLWHVSPIKAQGILRFGASYAAEYNNRFYAVAVWFRSKDSQMRLHRLACAPYAPDGTLACMLKISSALVIDEYPEVIRLTSGEFVLDKLAYQSQGWGPNPRSHKGVWLKSIEHEEPQPPAADTYQPMLTGVSAVG